MRNKLTLAVAAAACFLSIPSHAEASHNSPLAQAACAYRDAAIHFGHEVVREHRLTRFERRVAQQLVNATNRLYAVARHPHQHHRLREVWLDVEATHRHVEAILFAHPGCPVYVALWPCWQEVVCAWNDLSRLLIPYGCHGHHHHHPVTHLPPFQHHPTPLHGVSGRPGSPGLPGLTGFPGYFGVGDRSTPSLPSISQPSYRYRQAAVPSYRHGNFGHSLVPPASKILTSKSGRQVK